MLHNDLYFVDGHNEDNIIDTCNNTVLVNATFLGGENNQRKHFIAYCYLGELCTTAFGWNSFGIAFSCDHTYPKNSTYGLAKPFVIRCNS